MIKFLSPLLLLLIPAPVLAGIFDPVPTDQSLKYLGIIFGGNVGIINLGGDPNPVLSQLFSTFNGVVVSVAVVILGYIGVISVINTAQEGQTMGRKWSSVWIPMRSMLGMLLMVPTPGTGYSMIQVTIMWIIIQGIGAANLIWNVVLDNLAQGISATGGISVNTIKIKQHGDTLSQQLLHSAVCLETMKKLTSAPPPNNNGGAFPAAPSEFITNYGNEVKAWAVNDLPASPNTPDAAIYSGSLNIGVQDDPALGTFCGTYKVVVNVTKDEWPASLQSGANADIKAQEIYQAKQQAIGMMFSELRPIAKLLVDEQVTPRNSSNRLVDQKPTPSGYMQYTSDIYVNVLSSMVVPKSPEADVEEVVSAGKLNGWASAGSYYFVLNQSSNQDLFNTVNNEMPSQSGVPFSDIKSSTAFIKTYLNVDEFGYLKDRLKDAKVYADNDNTSTAGSLAVSYSLNKSGKKFLKPLMSLMQDVLKWWMDLIQKGSSDPLLAIAKFGAQLMMAAEITWLVIVVLSFLLAQLGVCAAESPLFMIPLALFFTAAPIILLTLTLLWGTGATMGVYLPMIPYMMFAVTMLGWMVACIEAMVAGPLLALGLVIPSGDELGRIAQGLPILFNIFLRPTLMIFGFILAARLFRAIMAFINFGFAQTFATIGIEGSFLMPLAAICLYTGFILTLANKCFALIYILPDRITRWMGGQAESTDAGGIQEAKQTFEKGKAAAEAGLKAGGKKSKELGEKMDSDIQQKATNLGKPMPGGPTG